jgi:glucan phosphoethanolaminetransferase (alkaline phosphatase superfamily)
MIPMTTKTEELVEELSLLGRQGIKISAILMLLLTFFNVLAYIFAATSFSHFLLGSLLGASLAIVNVFALGYAIYTFMLKRPHKLALLWPFLSFAAMCLAALFVAVFYTAEALGFAFGLATPLALASAIVFLSAKPA